MALRSGLAAQIGYVAETTFATYLAPTRFLEMVDESLELSIERIESAALRTGNQVLRSDRWKANKKGASGSVTHEVASKGFGLLFEHALGTVVTANPQGSVYTHTLTLGDTAGMSLGVQVGKPDRSGTVQPFSYLGAKIAAWELELGVDGILMFSPTFDVVDEDTTQSLATASYPANDELLVFTGGQVQIANADVDVQSFTLSVDNAVATDRYFLRNSPLKREQYQAGMTEITGSLEMEFEDLTEYQRFLDGTEAEIELVCEGSEIETGHNFGLTVTLPSCRFDGSTPQVGGPEILSLSLPFKVTNDGTNEPITLVYKTTDATP